MIVMNFFCDVGFRNCELIMLEDGEPVMESKKVGNNGHTIRKFGFENFENLDRVNTCQKSDEAKQTAQRILKHLTTLEYFLSLQNKQSSPCTFTVTFKPANTN